MVFFFFGVDLVLVINVVILHEVGAIEFLFASDI